MKINRIFLYYPFVLLVVFLAACSNEEPMPETTFQNEAHQLVYEMAQKAGTYQDLLDRKDVVYTYTYQTPDGKKDVTNEKYIFDGELSYARYDTHQRTLQQFEGPIEQGYDGQTFWLKHQGELVQEKEALDRVKFNRKTNFYWFSMMQKLLDPGLQYTYVKEEAVEGVTYDVVKITFQSEEGRPTDTYQVYLNRETGLVDQFLFTVVDFGVEETPYLMQLQYEEIDGLLIPTVRQYVQASWEGEPLGDSWIKVNWTDVSFNNGLTTEIFQKPTI